MIFYFSGTGNSLSIAWKMAETGEQLVNMAKARDEGAYKYSVKRGEKVGFIFPVYCYTINDIVLDFVRHLEITGHRYVYAIITCGGGIGFAGGFLRSELKKRGITLHCVYPLLMPDNSMLFYEIGPKEKLDKRLEESEELFKTVHQEIMKKRIKRAGFGFLSKALRPMYRLMKGTKKFRATDKCIGCGMCARNCPEHAIVMKNGKPCWEKETCIKCSACINRCPVEAIEYGKGTEGRTRYKNPDV